MVYAGRRRHRFRGEEAVVTVTDSTGSSRRLPHIETHSPTRFEWGYGGNGPAHLALSILADCVGIETAGRYYQDFKWEIIANLPLAGWKLTEHDIRAWLIGIQDHYSQIEAKETAPTSAH